MSAPEHDEASGLTRGAFLRGVGGAAFAVAVGGATPPFAFAGPLRFTGRQLKGELSILQWNHVVPAYDTWFDGTWAKRWGEQNDVLVSVDHVDHDRLPAMVAAEAKARKGHDLVGFLSPPLAHADALIDHGSIVREIERSVGPYGEVGRRSTYNPRTERYLGVCDGYAPTPAIWRHDLWSSVGASPATWEHVRDAAPRLAALGHPLGIGQSNDLESSLALLSYLQCFGAFVQDEADRPALGGRRAVEAVQLMAEIYRTGEDRAVLSWSAASNNQHLLSGRGSLILNAISAIRTAESIGLPFAPQLWLWPIPGGPLGRAAHPQHTSVYAIWTFAKNLEAAERFVADLCIGYREATLASRLFAYPAFPGAFPPAELYAAAAADATLPKGKYSILTTVASRHTRNVGYPGTTNVAVAEMLRRSLIPRMFSQVSTGQLTAAESVRATAWELKQIWRKARAAGTL